MLILCLCPEKGFGIFRFRLWHKQHHLACLYLACVSFPMCLIWFFFFFRACKLRTLVYYRMCLLFSLVYRVFCREESPEFRLHDVMECIRRLNHPRVAA